MKSEKTSGLIEDVKKQIQEINPLKKKERVDLRKSKITALKDMDDQDWREFEDINQVWRGPHPYEKGKMIGYWVLHGWHEISELRRKSNYCLQQKYSYASIMFQSWLMEIKTGERTKETVQAQEDKDFHELEILFYEDNKIKPVRFEREIYEADIIQVSEGIRKSFKTEGYARTWTQQKYEAVAKKLPLQMIHSVAVIGDPLLEGIKEGIQTLKNFNTDEDKGVVEKAFTTTIVLFQTIAKSMIRSTRRLGLEIIRPMTKLLLDLILRQALPLVLGLLSMFFGGHASTLNGFITKYAVKVLGLKLVGLTGFALSFAISYAVAYVIVLAIWKITDILMPLENEYQEIAEQIFIGTATPEKLEKEYNKKLDDIMDDDSLTYDEMKKKMVDVHKDFQDNVRPAIEKSLANIKGLDDQSWQDLLPKWIGKGVEYFKGLKTSSEQKSFLFRYIEKDMTIKMTERLESSLKSGEFGSVFFNILKGEEKVNPQILEMIKSRPQLIKDIQANIEPHLAV
jgi:hypothetical protein